jgi:hypothetical protein
MKGYLKSLLVRNKALILVQSTEHFEGDYLEVFVDEGVFNYCYPIDEQLHRKLIEDGFLLTLEEKENLIEWCNLNYNDFIDGQYYNAILLLAALQDTLLPKYFDSKMSEKQSWLNLKEENLITI